MFVTAALIAIVAAAAVLVAYMASHVDDEATQLEREVHRIRCQAEAGWSTARILRHHRRFCRCQVDYLRRCLSRSTWAH